MEGNDTQRTPIYGSCYTHGVDSKRRVQVPAKWRPKEEGTEFLLFLWDNGGDKGSCLRVYPPSEVRNLMDKVKSMPTGDPESIALRRNLARHADTVTLDKVGRICLPEAMARQVGLSDSAVLVGAIQWFEIWQPEKYALAEAEDEVLAPGAVKKFGF